MRLPAFLGGLLAIYGITRSASKLSGGYWVLLPLALLFANPTVLRYVTEVKPYGLDLGIAAFLMALHLRPRQGTQLLLWTATGMLLPWLSLPSVFVLAAVGLRNLYLDRRWMAVIGSWLASFLLLYRMVLNESVNADNLNTYHQAYFLNIPTDLEELVRLYELLIGLIKLAYGYTTVAIIGGFLLLMYGIIVSRRRWLTLPLAIVLVVAALHYYSLIDRLMLFVLPGMWLLATVAAKKLLDKPAVYRIVTIILIICLLTGSDAGRYIISPLRTSDGRALAELTDTGAHLYVDRGAVPVLDFYRRIHPNTRRPKNRSEAMDTLQFNSGETMLIYDVTTSEATLTRMAEASSRAAARGCEVDREMLYRAAVLRLKCP